MQNKGREMEMYSHKSIRGSGQPEMILKLAQYQPSILISNMDPSLILLDNP